MLGYQQPSSFDILCHEDEGLLSRIRALDTQKSGLIPMSEFRRQLEEKHVSADDRMVEELVSRCRSGGDQVGPWKGLFVCGLFRFSECTCWRMVAGGLPSLFCLLAATNGGEVWVLECAFPIIFLRSSGCLSAVCSMRARFPFPRWQCRPMLNYHMCWTTCLSPPPSHTHTHSLSLTHTHTH